MTNIIRGAFFTINNNLTTLHNGIATNGYRIWSFHRKTNSIIEGKFNNLDVKLEGLLNHVSPTTFGQGDGIYTIVAVRSKDKFDVIHNFKGNLPADGNLLNDSICKALVEASKLII